MEGDLCVVFLRGKVVVVGHIFPVYFAMPSNVLGAQCEGCHFNPHRNTVDGSCYHPDFTDEKTEAWVGRVFASHHPADKGRTGTQTQTAFCARIQPRHYVAFSCHLPVSSGRGQFSSLVLRTARWPLCRAVS